jgi:methylisocitrate lyase
MEPSNGLREALTDECPLQIVGTINAYTALLAEKAGHRALYLSGAGLANAAFGLPDLAMTTATEVAEEVRRIRAVTNLPLLVDIDTGFGNAFNIARTIKTMVAAGASAVHIEDQVQSKRCGHRPKKALVSANEMCDRLKAAQDANTDPNFIIMARTDALDVEGIQKTLARIEQYVDAGAQMIFFEGATALTDYLQVTQACRVPVLANITEFGRTPLFTRDELKGVGVKLILYPLTAFRAMSAAALNVYETLKQTGTQSSLIPNMQTREALYDVLHYHAYEQKLDELFEEGKQDER